MDSVSVARFLSIPSAFLVSGYSIAASQGTIPLVYNQPASISTEILKGVFYQGGKFVIPGALISASASGYLAYEFPEQRHQLVASAVLAIAAPAFTRIVMYPGIQRLLQINENAVEQQKADQSGEVNQLLKAWVAQNWVRAACAFSAGILAMWTTSHRIIVLV